MPTYGGHLHVAGHGSGSLVTFYEGDMSPFFLRSLLCFDQMFSIGDYLDKFTLILVP